MDEARPLAWGAVLDFLKVNKSGLELLAAALVFWPLRGAALAFDPHSAPVLFGHGLDRRRTGVTSFARRPSAPSLLATELGRTSTMNSLFEEPVHLHAIAVRCCRERK